MCKFLLNIPSSLQKFTNNSEIQLKGSSVGELFNCMKKSYSDLHGAITDESGNLSRFVKIFVNSTPIEALDGENTKLESSDKIKIILAVAGG